LHGNTWIDASLAATGANSERERRLPASATILFVIAMGVLRDRAIADVANDLRLVRKRPGDAPLRSNAISAAWARLGEAPAADLAARPSVLMKAEEAVKVSMFGEALAEVSLTGGELDGRGPAHGRDVPGRSPRVEPRAPSVNEN
jgi:hypothetical protein